MNNLSPLHNICICVRRIGRLYHKSRTLRLKQIKNITKLITTPLDIKTSSGESITFLLCTGMYDGKMFLHGDWRILPVPAQVPADLAKEPEQKELSSLLSGYCRSFDFVIINAPLPDESGTRFAIDTSCLKNTVVLLLVRTGIYDTIRYETSCYGVFVLPKPVPDLPWRRRPTG